jgi:hypothetical protein
MHKLILATVILTVGWISPGLARGGHGHMRGHAHGHMHGHKNGLGHGHSRNPTDALSISANPSGPPSLTSDSRLIGNAPLPSRRKSGKADLSASGKLDAEDAKLDKRIKSICRGC